MQFQERNYKDAIKFNDFANRSLSFKDDIQNFNQVLNLFDKWKKVEVKGRYSEFVVILSMNQNELNSFGQALDEFTEWKDEKNDNVNEYLEQETN